MKREKTKLATALVLAGLLGPLPAQANSDRESLEALRQTTYAILDALVEKGILTQEAARDLVRQAETKGLRAAEEASQAEKAAGVVRVPYIPEVVKRELREQIRHEVVAQAKLERWGDVNTVPEWLDRLKWEGDLRVRYQQDNYAKDNVDASEFRVNGVPLNNTTDERDRQRVRGRLALSARLSDTFSGGLRVTTGNTSDPVSTNQTLGTTANKYSLVLDRAFLNATPTEWLKFSGGRIPNPFFSTDLVWDDDVNFEGLALSFTPWARSTRSFKPFATVGLFPLQEVESSPINLAQDKWLYAAQVGLDWRLSSYTRWRMGVAYYDYRHVKGVENPVSAVPNSVQAGPYDSTAPQFRQKGNTLMVIDNDLNGDLVPDTDRSKWIYGLAADYRLVNATFALDLGHFEPWHIVLSGDLVKNIGYDEDEVNTLLEVDDYASGVEGWQARITVGMPSLSMPGDWQFFAGYRHLERDAVLDAFTDSDFQLGGTNTKGYFLGGSYGLDRNAWLSVKWMSADEILGLRLGTNVLQVDLNAKF